MGKKFIRPLLIEHDDCRRRSPDEGSQRWRPMAIDVAGDRRRQQ